MNDKAAKRLRKALRIANFPKSELMINTRTGQIRNGPGARHTYQNAKRRLTAAQCRDLCEGVLKLAANPL